MSLLQLLQERGIPERAGRIYLAAVREGPQTASELARAAAVDRVEAYRMLSQLEEAGLLIGTSARPKKFAALPPAELVERWIRDASQRLNQLEADRNRLLSGLNEDLSHPEADSKGRFAVIEGRESIAKFLRKRIGAAKREVLLATTASDLAMAVDGGVDRALREARTRGVAVRVAMDIERRDLFEAKHLASLVDARHVRGPIASRVVVVDRAGALVLVPGHQGARPSGEAQLAVWSTGERFIRQAREYHHHLWAHGERAEARIVEIEAPSNAVLPVVRGKEAEPFRRLGEIAELGMTATGVEELRLDLPELIDTVARQLGRQLAEEIEGDSPEDVLRSLSSYYQNHAMGRLTVIRDKPLTLRVSQCFACTSQSPEIGRVLCAQMLRTVLESRIGPGWEVSKPDPRKHAQCGCVFKVSPA